MPRPKSARKCKACGGSGKSSRGGKYFPCGGKGAMKAKRFVSPEANSKPPKYVPNNRGG